MIPSRSTTFLSSLYVWNSESNQKTNVPIEWMKTIQVCEKQTQQSNERES